MVEKERFGPQPKIPQREKPEYPKIELGAKEDYIYFSQRQVYPILLRFGYGENMRRVNTLYLSKDKSKAVGVWCAIQEEGHFIDNPVLRGVEQAEAIGQTLLVALVLANKIPEGKSVRLTSIDLDYPSTAIPPVDLDTVIMLGEFEKDKRAEITGYGEVRCGENILSQGYVSGVLLDNKLAERLLEKTRRQQGNAITLFPFQG
jgi:hypothetical protein